MNRAAKLLLTDQDDRYLLLIRSNHPLYPHDPDIPGGKVEINEQPLEAVVRELGEETGIKINQKTVSKLTESQAYQDNFTYYLYASKIDNANVRISWEHQSFEWLTLDQFISKIKLAKDSYMHMVYDFLAQQ